MLAILLSLVLFSFYLKSRNQQFAALVNKIQYLDKSRTSNKLISGIKINLTQENIIRKFKENHKQIVTNLSPKKICYVGQNGN
jgi:hypothetical protein